MPVQVNSYPYAFLLPSGSALVIAGKDAPCDLKCMWKDMQDWLLCRDGANSEDFLGAPCFMRSAALNPSKVPYRQLDGRSILHT